MERRLQLLTNVAFLGLCLVGVALGIRALAWPKPPAQVVAVAPPPPTRPEPPLYREGERIALSGVAFNQSDYTLLLVTQKGCRYCDQSMPFYKTLGTDEALAQHTRVVLVAPDEEAESRAELEKHGVRVDQIVRTSLGALKVRGTPTAIVVNRQGLIERVLPGLLDESRQSQLLNVLKKTEGSN